mmetsp:Transcript_21935/g.39769  ORF Transcript_21935/g.39769 Transcript_21935/m.39769 type:complete len:276 (-) Transcript_21935:28-855(-)
MTEFRRAVASVEVVEQLVSDLASSVSPQGFPFYPRARSEVAITDDDWIVVGSRSAVEVRVSEEQREKFAEVETRLVDLDPIIERMRKRCRARADLETAKAELRELLPEASGDPTGAARACVDAGGEGSEIVQSLLNRVAELEAAATYGAKMVEQVLDLLARFDAVRALFNTDVIPRLGAAVAAAAANDAAWRATVERQEEKAAAEEVRRAQEEAWRPVAELLAESERRLQEQREAQELAEWQCAQSRVDECITLPISECSRSARAVLPGVMWLYS